MARTIPLDLRDKKYWPPVYLEQQRGARNPYCVVCLQADIPEKRMAMKAFHIPGRPDTKMRFAYCHSECVDKFEERISEYCFRYVGREVLKRLGVYNE